MTAAELLEQAEAALEGVTGEPWRHEVSEQLQNEACVVGSKPEGLHIVADHIDIPDATFIAAARMLVPALAARLRDALTVIEAARKVRGLGPGNYCRCGHKTHPDCPQHVVGPAELTDTLAAFDAGPAATEEAKTE